MREKNSRKNIEDCIDHAASANECTGALQHVDIDTEELAEFHKKYNSK